MNFNLINLGIVRNAVFIVYPLKINNLKIILFCLLIPLITGCGTDKNEKKKPNIIIFFTDDQGYGDVGSYGAIGYETPNFDQLAEDGIKFTDFYVPATVCTPSRAGLLTGKYPERVDLHEAVLFPFSEDGLSPEEFTMAEMLQENGYATSCIGKWHLGHMEKYMPNNHGFDYFYGVPYSNDMNSYYYKDRDFQSPHLPVYRNLEKIEEDPDQRYLTKRYTEETIKRIQERDEKPFFVYLAHSMPHIPLHVSEDFAGKSDQGLYGDVIMELDWSLGEIVKTLKEEGIYDNTIILFTSDNGPLKRVGGSAGSLRGQKAQTWEGGQRVPAIMVWPDVIPPGKICKEVVSTLDLYPTFASIIGATLPKDLILDGRDINDLLRKPKSTELPEQPFFYYARNGEVEAVRLGNWKLHVSKSIGWDKEDNGDFPISLYNLEKDIGETKNVVDAYPDKVQEMKILIEDFDTKIK